MSDIFLSYAKEDRELVEDLAAALETTYWSVFWDRTVPAGMTWREFIGTELKEARCVVVGWSAASVASEWVLEEAEIGKKRKILIPALFEEVEPPLGFRSLQASDLSAWKGGAQEPAFQRLVKDMVRLLGSPPGQLVVEEQRQADEAAERHAQEEAQRKAEEEERRAQEDAKRQAELEEAKRKPEATGKPGVIAKGVSEQKAKATALRQLAQTRDLSSVLDLKRFGFSYWLAGAYFVASLLKWLGGQIWIWLRLDSVPVTWHSSLAQVPYWLILAVAFTLVCSLRLRLWQRILAWGVIMPLVGAFFTYLMSGLEANWNLPSLLWNFSYAALFMAVLQQAVGKLGIRWSDLAVGLASFELLWFLLSQLIEGGQGLEQLFYRMVGGFVTGLLIFAGLYFQQRHRLQI